MHPVLHFLLHLLYFILHFFLSLSSAYSADSRKREGINERKNKREREEHQTALPMPSPVIRCEQQGERVNGFCCSARFFFLKFLFNILFLCSFLIDFSFLFLVVSIFLFLNKVSDGCSFSCDCFVLWCWRFQISLQGEKRKKKNKLPLWKLSHFYFSL